MSDELREGVELRSVTGPTESYMVGSAPWSCRRIVVTMQTGQMAMVPWARCEANSGEVNMVNLALAESVMLMEVDNG